VSTVPEPSRPQHLAHIAGRIDIRDAGFRYGNRAVIKGMNLSIAPEK